MLFSVTMFISGFIWVNYCFVTDQFFNIFWRNRIRTWNANANTRGWNGLASNWAIASQREFAIKPNVTANSRWNASRIQKVSSSSFSKNFIKKFRWIINFKLFVFHLCRYDASFRLFNAYVKIVTKKLIKLFWFHNKNSFKLVSSLKTKTNFYSKCKADKYENN